MPSSIKAARPPFRFGNYFLAPYPPPLNPFSPIEVPDDDMYNVSPFPDFEDSEQVQKYIQDRRVVGVCLFIQADR
jgi:hypothetical protein